MKHKKVRFVSENKTQFASVLRSRVNAYFTDNNISKYANGAMVFKSVILISAYVLPFLAMLIFLPNVWISLGLFFTMGIAKAGVGMGVMHDANHGSYSKNNNVNWWLSHVLHGLGGSTHNWKLQHNLLHHTFTNIDGLDDDIQDRVTLKFSPHTPVKGYHKHQWIFSFFFYGLTTLYWVLAKDYMQYKRYSGQGVHTKSGGQNSWWLVRVSIMKITYLFTFLVLPIVVGMQWQVVFGGFFLMHFVAGLLLTLTFQLAHTLEQTTHPLPNETGNIENDWAIHQMETTVNFSPNNKFLSWYMGGLNYQVEHHLFMGISHVHYPAIAPIVRETAKEFGVPYLVNPTLGAALKSHIRYMKTLGKLPDLNEVMG